jgi:hypothetical protein
MRAENAGVSTAIERLSGKIRVTFGAARGRVLVTLDLDPDLTPTSPDLRRENEAVSHLTTPFGVRVPISAVMLPAVN